MPEDQSYHELPADRFPFTMQAFSTRDGSMVWERLIKAPGPVWVPPLAKQIGCPVTIRITWPDGTVTDG